MKTCKCGPKWLPIALCSIVLGFASEGAADEIQNISNLVSNVAKTTVPNRGYSATVHQTVSRTNIPALAGGISSSAPGNAIQEADYDISCDVSGVLRATKGRSLKRFVQTTTTNSTASAVAEHDGLMIIMNPINALRHIETLHSSTITNDLYLNIPCFKISAEDHGFRFIMWIGQADFDVHRQVILQNSNILFDTSFEYKKWSGYDVPTRVVITKPSNGTQITQIFAGHAFEESKGGN